MESMFIEAKQSGNAYARGAFIVLNTTKYNISGKRVTEIFNSAQTYHDFKSHCRDEVRSQEQVQQNAAADKGKEV